MDLHSGEEARKRPFAVVELHGRPRAGWQRLRQRLIQRDVNAHALSVSYPAVRGLRLGELAVNRLLACEDPRVAAGHVGAEHLPREGVKHYGGIGALTGMAQALLAEIGHDIGLVVYQRQRGGAG